MVIIIKYKIEISVVYDHQSTKYTSPWVTRHKPISVALKELKIKLKIIFNNKWGFHEVSNVKYKKWKFLKYFIKIKMSISNVF